MYRVLNSDPRIKDEEDAVEYEPVNGEIEIDKVTFGYEDDS